MGVKQSLGKPSMMIESAGLFRYKRTVSLMHQARSSLTHFNYLLKTELHLRCYCLWKRFSSAFAEELSFYDVKRANYALGN